MLLLRKSKVIIMKTVTNSCGVFWIDENGLLCKFECAEQNYYKPLNDPDYRNERHLDYLRIPEGVTSLPCGAFDGYTVFMEVEFPNTLTVLGDSAGGVFRRCHLSHTLELPSGVNFVGEDSFFLSVLDTVQIPIDTDAQTAQKLKLLFKNHTCLNGLYYPIEKIRDLPAPQTSATALCNESGTFYVDKMGVLQSFYCSPQNNADTCSCHNTKKLYSLHIPEGVTVLKEFAFRGYTVMNSLTLPDSLQMAGTCSNGCAFADCRLPDTVIPDTLRFLGAYGFGNSTLRSLRLPENADWEYSRQFKSAKIGTLYLSESYRLDSERTGARIETGSLGSIGSNEVDVERIVWLERN